MPAARRLDQRQYRDLFQLDRPIGVVEKLLPAPISVVAQMDVDERIVGRPDGRLDEFHVRFLWGSSALLDVARSAGANDVLPGGFAAERSRNHVVEGQLTGGEMLAAILAPVFVAGEDVPSVELHVGSRKAVVKEQPDDPRHGDVETHR